MRNDLNIDIFQLIGWRHNHQPQAVTPGLGERASSAINQY
jgi:hypothetical protein